eukprot:c27792_g1_i1.p1 GENE.c27792_g1_i1~~c27792_g1_i1.p1  ORF type:complete len:121 (+),score=34.38 c27792_g1_i1:2-364(+)
MPQSGLSAVLQAITASHHLTHLEMPFCSLGAGSIEDLCSVVATNSVITHLNLYENELDTQAALKLAAALSENKSLVELNVQGNVTIGQEGTKALLNAKPEQTTLLVDDNENIVTWSVEIN